MEQSRRNQMPRLKNQEQGKKIEKKELVGRGPRKSDDTQKRSFKEGVDPGDSSIKGY